MSLQTTKPNPNSRYLQFAISKQICTRTHANTYDPSVPEFQVRNKVVPNFKKKCKAVFANYQKMLMSNIT